MDIKDFYLRQTSCEYNNFVEVGQTFEKIINSWSLENKDIANVSFNVDLGFKIGLLE
jgi:hypothetical protein